MKLRKQSFYRALKIIFGICIIVVLLRMIDINTAIELLSKVSVPFFAIVVFICTFDKVFMALKWNFLLRVFRIQVPFWVPIIAYLRGKVFVLVTPLGLGMDAYKTYYLKEHNVPVIKTVSSILIERSLGAVSSLAVVSLLLPLSLHKLQIPFQNLLIIGGFLSFIGISVVVILLIKMSHKFKNISSSKILPKKIGNKLHELIEVIEIAKDKKIYIWYYFLLSIVEKLFYGTAIYFSALSIGIHYIDYLYVISATPLLALLERLPFSFSSVGLREGLFVVLLKPYISDPTIPVTVALVLRFAEIVMMFLCSLLWLGRYDGKTYREKMLSINDEMKYFKKGSLKENI